MNFHYVLQALTLPPNKSLNKNQDQSAMKRDENDVNTLVNHVKTSMRNQGYMLLESSLLFNCVNNGNAKVRGL